MERSPGGASKLEAAISFSAPTPIIALAMPVGGTEEAAPFGEAAHLPMRSGTRAQNASHWARGRPATRFSGSRASWDCAGTRTEGHRCPYDRGLEAISPEQNSTRLSYRPCQGGSGNAKEFFHCGYQ